jgi:enterochelin esterase-like enzyme
MLPMREVPDTRWRMLAALAVIPAVLVGALGINADFGLYRTAQDVVDAIAPPPVQQFEPIAASTTGAQDLARWVAPPDMPSSGVVRRAEIPGTVSGFAARTALVWLPPAAQVAEPPALPLLVLLAGQPGDPASFWSAARLEQLMEGFQATHGGLAPIVVVPDQNGANDVNLLCADTTVARVDTYLSVDLVAWARANLPVLTDRTSMAIGGYSQGATCSLQVGLRHPDLFATVLAMAPERSIFDDPAALPKYFAGDRAAGDPFDPPWILANTGPFPPMQLLLAVGEQDAVFTPNVQETARAARSAGIAATTWSVPGTAHDFYMVYGAVEHFLPDMAATMGIPASGSP